MSDVTGFPLLWDQLQTRRVKWRKPLAWLLVLLLGGTGGYWWWYQWRDHSQDAPILAAARRYGVQPALVKAIVWRESRLIPEDGGGPARLD